MTDQSRGYSLLAPVAGHDFGDGQGPRRAWALFTWFGPGVPPPGAAPDETRYFETEREAARFILERGEVLD